MKNAKKDAILETYTTIFSCNECTVSGRLLTVASAIAMQYILRDVFWSILSDHIVDVKLSDTVLCPQHYRALHMPTSMIDRIYRVKL